MAVIKENTFNGNVGDIIFIMSLWSILTSMSKSTSPGSLIRLGSEHGLARGSFLGRPYEIEHSFSFIEFCVSVVL